MIPCPQFRDNPNLGQALGSGITRRKDFWSSWQRRVTTTIEFWVSLVLR